MGRQQGECAWVGYRGWEGREPSGEEEGESGGDLRMGKRDTEGRRSQVGQR